MTARPPLLPLRLPRAGLGVVKAQTYDAAMQQIEQADSASIKAGTTPTLPALILTAPDGSSWKVEVAADGSLHTTAVGR